MRHYSEYGFADLANARRYASGSPRAFLPGMSMMHDLTQQLIGESTPDDGQVLVVGAGGGLEIRAWAEREPRWHFVAVEPSPEMILAGRENLVALSNQVNWIEGYIEDAPSGPYDAGTCLLTLHLIPDDGSKLATLTEIRKRLKPGGRFALVDNCFDRMDPNLDRILDRFIAQARRSGIVDEELLEMVRRNNREKGESVTAAREVELLRQAGFVEIDLYFAALSWRGFICRTPSQA